MYILIVDDEYYARKATVKIVTEWNAQVETGEAENGQEALDMVMRRMPDLLLVDVRMPGMDGIELCRRLRELSEEVDIVIISGYADFSYAQQAIHFRVEQYILKPVFPQTLREALDRSQAALIARRASSRRLRDAKEIRMLVRLLSDNRVLVSEQEEQTFFAWRRYQILVVRLSEYEPAQGEAGYRRLIDAFCSAEGAVSFFHDQYPNEIVVLHRSMGSEEEMKRAVQAQLQAMRRSGELKRVWAVGLGTAVTDYHELASSYQTAVYALGMKLLRPDTLIADGRSPGKSAYEIPQAMDALAELLARGEAEQAVQMLRQRLRQPGYTLRGLHEDYHYLLNAIVHAGYRLGVPDWSRQAAQISFMRLCDFDTLGELVEYLEMYIRKLAAREEKGRGDIVDQTLEYIHAHFSEDLLLGDIAQSVVFVNVCYLSRCIKAKTGSNFSQLLQKERLRRARELLEGGKLSVSSVAAMVGYNKVSHFIEVYKRTFGATPGKDRK